MTTIQETLAGLPEETKKRIEPVFGSVEILYEVVYLVAIQDGGDSSDTFASGEIAYFLWFGRKGNSCRYCQ